MPAGAVDASVLGKLVGTVDVGTVDVGAVDVGAIEVAPATDETGTTEFSWTALDDAPDCWPSLPLRCGIKRGLALETSPRAVNSSRSDENKVCIFILKGLGHANTVERNGKERRKARRMSDTNCRLYLPLRMY